MTAVTVRPLTVIVTEVIAEVELAERHWDAALGHAIRAGELLIEAKAQCRHGEWLPWLTEHFAFTRQTAASYMRLAKAREQMEGAPSISAALKQLAPAKEILSVNAKCQIQDVIDSIGDLLEGTASEGGEGAIGALQRRLDDCDADDLTAIGEDAALWETAAGIYLARRSEVVA